MTKRTEYTESHSFARKASQPNIPSSSARNTPNLSGWKWIIGYEDLVFARRMSLRGEALLWMEEAKADLRHARSSLSSGEYNWCCFAAQQGVEKALKALIMAQVRRRPPRGHDLVMLYSRLRRRPNLPEEIEEGLSELSAFYTVARYPNAGLERPSREINRAQAERALRVAEEVLKHVGEIFGTTRKG